MKVSWIRYRVLGMLLFTSFFITLTYNLVCKDNVLRSEEGKSAVSLPKPRLSSKVSVEEALRNRRSVREYKPGKLDISEIAQILWSAQGITSNWGGRTAPSAGALYPIEIYLIAGDVSGLDIGVYHYKPEEHALIKIISGDIRKELSKAALGQASIQEAPVSIVIAGVYERTTRKYGERGVRYVHIEVGHVGQNIYLQAQALGLGTVMMGAFDDNKVKEVLKIQEAEPLAIMPIGRI